MTLRLSRRSIKIILICFAIFLVQLTLIRFQYFKGQRNELQLVTEVFKARNQSVCTIKNISKKPIEITTEIPSWEEINAAPWAKNVFNGYWSPKDCIRNDTIAIIIPYRDRESHLRKLLSHLHPFLQRQNAQYQIYVIEQSSIGIYNKGAILNAGYHIASLSDREFNCFIFHDVDMLPIKNENIYQCAENPLHLGAAVDKFNFKLVYNTIVGGVLALNRKQFVKLNGYSNIFVGWGGEDDDMAERIRLEKYNVVRYPIEIGQYIMIKHQPDKGNPINENRVKMLTETKSRYKTDGLSNVKYKIKEESNHISNLVTWITVDIENIK